MLGERFEGVMLDRNILKKLKRKVLRACVYTSNALICIWRQWRLTETTTAAESWFWFCRITRTKRVDERKMNGPDEICDATKTIQPEDW